MYNYIVIVTKQANVGGMSSFAGNIFFTQYLQVKNKGRYHTLLSHSAPLLYNNCTNKTKKKNIFVGSFAPASYFLL